MLIWLLYLTCAAAACYQAIALVAVLRQLARRDRSSAGFLPTVSILKPVHGCDQWFEQAARSHANLDYPAYELLFAAPSAADPSAAAALAIPGARLYVRTLETPNPKVASLIELARHATGEVLVVNDADIRVRADYLRRIVAPLADPGAGLVTCLYRPVPSGLPAAWESLGIATDFAPSTLVAPLAGINEFGFGSTLCFRAADLRKAGGFEAIADYLADDYQLAARLTRGLGKRAVLSRFVVDTGLHYACWRDMWRHQIRWARTIRVSRKEYLGLPVTHAGLWALVAALAGHFQIAAALLGLRILMGFTAGVLLLRARAAWALVLIPLWDLFAFAVWVAALGGNTIEWRGRRLRLSPDGRLSPR